MRRIPTGSATLDATLDGGILEGSLMILEGPQGVGSTEFALTLLHSAGLRTQRAVFATVLRTPPSVREEAAILFGGEIEASVIDFVAIRREHALADCSAAMGRLSRGDVLVVESVSAIARGPSGSDLAGFLEEIGRMARDRGAAVFLLHSSGALPAALEMALGEIADGILSFGWRDGGSMRRRCLFITKLRGLAAGLGGDHLPVFEATLACGPGFTLSRVRSVV